MGFQSTHPSWGATFNAIMVDNEPDNFNPRTHRGVRHTTLPTKLEPASISIHAPIVGCDLKLSHSTCTNVVFQSTHPSWGATPHASHCFHSNHNFNPRTHRGVRRSNSFKSNAQILISIHAPIVGCDTISY